jgi:hypothetical protein
MRVKGDRYRPIVTVLKVKKDVPSVIQVSGRTYILQHEDQYKGGQHERTTGQRNP